MGGVHRALYSLLAKLLFKSRFENKVEAHDAELEDKLKEVEQRMIGLTRMMEENNKEEEEGMVDGPKKKEDNEDPATYTTDTPQNTI